MAIQGIGVDTIEINRIKKTIEANEKFLEKVFTDNEIKYCKAKKNSFESYAARFAAKEAFSKALGTGVGKSFSWLDIEILNDKLGKPAIRMVNKILIDSKSKIHLSLTHTKDYSTAFVIIEI